MQDKITLYHGGSLDSVATILWHGPEVGRSFYCTRNFDLAREAAYSHPFGRVAKIELPLDEFRHAVSQGYFVEKPYLGMIAIQGAREIEVKPGEGVKAIRRAIQAARPLY